MFSPGCFVQKVIVHKNCAYIGERAWERAWDQGYEFSWLWCITWCIPAPFMCKWFKCQLYASSLSDSNLNNSAKECNVLNRHRPKEKEGMNKNWLMSGIELRIYDCRILYMHKPVYALMKYHRLRIETATCVLRVNVYLNTRCMSTIACARHDTTLDKCLHRIHCLFGCRPMTYDWSGHND